jgi:hypothetical protein
MKRFTIPAIVLGIFVLTMLIARPALTGPQDEKKTVEQPTIEQLQKERIEALEKLIEKVKRQYETGAGPYKDIAEYVKVQEELIEAKLDATEDIHERIALREQQVKIVQEVFDYVKGQRDTGFNATDIELYRAKAYLLSVQIKLAKERSKAKPGE